MIRTEDYIGDLEVKAAPDDLPACPFCGECPLELVGGLQVDKWWSYVVHCENCGCDGPAYGVATEVEAIETCLQTWRERHRILRGVVSKERRRVTGFEETTMNTENAEPKTPVHPDCSTALPEAIEAVSFWLDLWENEQAEIDDVSDCDEEERNTIKAVQRVLRAIPSHDEYVAWLRWNGHTFVACDSDSDGAFRVCRHPLDLP